MIITALLLLAAAQDTTNTWDGRAGRTTVRIPSSDSVAVVDGRLDEGVWTRAAKLTGFSQYQPVDGRPAVEPTEVLVWYSSDAIWFGIRASEIHGDVVRATRANRDNIQSEDHVQILLDTYNDRRNAFLFGVNALGVQQDGTRSDQWGGGAGGRSATGGGMRDMNPLDGSVDLNPDFYFESRGRLVEGGYEVEIRIPFKSLRYQEGNIQNWGIHVLRRVQHSGTQDSWVAANRASASFLSQAGSLEDLHDLKRGLVLEATPTVTARLDGAYDADRWRRNGAQDVSADVRWGIRQNLSLNATINPDFSQVEADVGQVTVNERFALFFPEKRPFFLDGLELFDTPNQLIYTRRIVSPDVGVKLAGKVLNTNVATMLALDDSERSWSGDGRPVFGIARLRRELGSSTSLGGVITAREDGNDHSRLAGADVRIYHSKLYFVQLQAVQSWTDSSGRATTGPMFDAVWDRTGRRWGFHYSANAISPGFRAASGFVSRTGVIDGSLTNRLSFYGDSDAMVQTWGAFTRLSRLTSYDRPGDGALEGGESVSPSATLRGGWRLSGSLSRNFYSYDPASYSGYSITRNGAPDSFTVPGPERDLVSTSLGVTTPTFRRFTSSVSLGRGQTPIFREAAPGRSSRFDTSLDLRPTAGLRTTLQYTHFLLDRQRDGSRYSSEAIPRFKAEYQLSRSIFVRVIAQYTAREREPLLDRDGNRISVGGITDGGSSSNELRADWLFSYRPVPGTLFYFGYGATMDEPEQFRFSDLKRNNDGFFLKGSYLLRF